MDPTVLAALQALGPSLSQLSTAVGVLVPQLQPLTQTFNALNAASQTLLHQMENWAAALSPATVYSLDLSLRNLDATLGQAVVPAFQTMAGVVDRFAGILSPAAEALAPALQGLAGAVSAPLLDLVRTFAEAFGGLLPAVQPVLGLFGALAATLGPLLTTFVNLLAQPVALFGALAEVLTLLLTPARVFGEVLTVLTTPLRFAFETLTLALLPVTAVVDALGTALSGLHEITRGVQLIFEAAFLTLKDVVLAALEPFIGGVKSAGDALRNALIDCAKQVILFAAKIAAFFGQTAFIDNLLKLIDKEGNEKGAVAAPQNVRVQDFQAIARDMVQAAFAAGPGGAQDKNERDWLREISGDLKALKANPNDIKKTVEDGVRDTLEGVNKTAERMLGDLRKSVDFLIQALNRVPGQRGNNGQ